MDNCKEVSQYDHTKNLHGTPVTKRAPDAETEWGKPNCAIILFAQWALHTYSLEIPFQVKDLQ